MQPTTMEICKLFIIVLFYTEHVQGKCQSGKNESHLEVVFSWEKSVKIAIPDPKGILASVVDGVGNPIGIKVFNDNIYVTIPRWSSRGGRPIPVNLGVTPKPVIYLYCSRDEPPHSPIWAMSIRSKDRTWKSLIVQASPCHVDLTTRKFQY